ncbi:caytaxin-like isoform X3 [Paramormyrops kingsleyae]|uniref:caytaxin-like isoform X3 n=1 Tax=Paramormyrops kingsleyae TaxID=1676925 RepID=UPI000CD63E1B|nr:caytaxin-like isoform X3 [Paramormyrops kingsleyae]
MGTYTDKRNQYFLDGGPEVSKVRHNIQDMELREEWQDEDLPRPLPEDVQSPGGGPLDHSGAGERPAKPTSLALSGGGHPRKRRLVAPTLSLTLDHSDSIMSDEFASAALSPTPEDDDDDDGELDFNLDAMDTPSDSESSNFQGSVAELEWEDDLPRRARVRGGVLRSSVGEQAEMGLPELDQVDSQGCRWRHFRIGSQECRVNMSVLEPYLQVLSHGGYCGDGMNAIIVFSTCYLPENTTKDYQYVMDNLFRLRKNLKSVLVVHPLWYIKALITIIKPFVSVKFNRKIRLVHSLKELSQILPMAQVQIPDCVRRFDETMNK